MRTVSRVIIVGADILALLCACIAVWSLLEMAASSDNYVELAARGALAIGLAVAPSCAALALRRLLT